MKKQFAIFLFLIISFTLNAQNQKQAKEKLAAFIKEYYTIKKEISFSSVNTQDFEEKSYKNFIIEFSNDNIIMTFSYDYQFEYGSTMTDVRDFYTIKNKILLDFNTIESVTLETVNTLNKNKQLFVLNFKTKPDTTITKYVSGKDKNLSETPEKVTEVAIPVNTNCCEDNDFKQINNKIVKFFNELIKLSQTNTLQNK